MKAPTRSARRFVRAVDFAHKLPLYKKLGFEGVQFHDDDAIPDVDNLSSSAVMAKAAELKRILDSEGLVAEFVSPRLWESPRGVDGAFTANDPAVRRWAMDRTLRAIDIANVLETGIVGLWLARDGSYIRESKNAIVAHQQLLDVFNRILEYDPNISLVVEPKPNEPAEFGYLPTMGHVLALAAKSVAPFSGWRRARNRSLGARRSGSIRRTGLYPVAGQTLERASQRPERTQVRPGQDLWRPPICDRPTIRSACLNWGATAATKRFIGFDVKAMRTKRPRRAEKHLSNSRAIFLWLVEKVRTFPRDVEQQLIAERDYEELELAVLRHLMGK